ncbi:MAG: NADH dehydrogenase (quinone) subunit G [Desulfobacteraceae bacterium]|nr:MAG: NADH dehydrogenase (quinone) subunit G [Desulfobacteraceae bacterium]
MPTVTINGKEITVEEGTLILDAARRAGFYIPTFCYQADLIGIGSCRMCLVEVVGQQKLIASCVTRVMDGMQVITESETVNAARAAMLEFLLANHGLDCPVCDKGGECELQDQVYTYGPHRGRYAEQKYRWHDKDYIISPVIIKNSNRCVQCMKCVRVCKEVVGQDVLDGIGRGERQEETTFFRGMLECDQDGNCIEVCPVGCFMRLPFRYKTRPWDLKAAHTICPYCATGCRMVIEERAGEVIRSKAQLGVGINSETLCARGRFGYDIVHHGERLTTPLLKRNGKLEPASWQEAFAVIRERLKRADPMKIGGIASARLTNEELYLFQKLFRNVLKSPNIDSSLRWQPAAVTGFVAATRMNHGGVSVFDAMQADCVLIIGTHLSDENPVTDYMVRRMARENGTAVMIASPRAMKLDRSARLTLRHIPGTGKKLLEALTLLLGEQNAERLSTHAAVTAVKDVGAQPLLSAADVSSEKAAQLAALLNNASSVGIMAGTEFLRFPQGLTALKTFGEVLQALGKKLLIVPILDRCNQRGAWEMGVHPGLHPDFRKSQLTGLGHDGMFQAAERGEMQSLFLIQEDPLAAAADPAFIKRALERVNFLLVQDIFLTETAKLADCVLPGACFAEKEGTFTNQEGRVQSIARLMRPPGRSMRDFKIIAAIGKLFDPSFAEGTENASSVFSEIRKAVGMYTHVSLVFNNKRNEDNDLDNKSALIEASEAAAVDVDALDAALSAGDGDQERPFTLITGNHLFHSGRLSRRSNILNSLLKEPVAEISAEDAAALGISSGEKIRVQGRRHEALLTLKTKRGSKNGVVFIDENFESVAVNRFFERGRFMAKVNIVKE